MGVDPNMLSAIQLQNTIIEDSKKPRLEDSDVNHCKPYNPKLGKGEIHSSDYIENKQVGIYKIIKVIGKGSSGTVVLAVNKNSGERVAIKIIKKGFSKELYEASDKRIYREVIISTLLNHPNIVRMLDFFYSDTHYFLVFEYIKGMQLYDVVVKNQCIDEEKARQYFRQIISAIDYMHRNCISHRDLKIENILIDQNDNIKIIDFGLSNFYDNKALLNTFCGSLYFAAPELLSGKKYYGPEVDVWSLGVVLYVMLNGKVPFDDDSILVLQGKIKNVDYDFHKPISNEAKELLTQMLTNNNRIGLAAIKKSNWINIGYENIAHNFMICRQPIKKLNKELLNALEPALSFQFSNVTNDLNSFVNICSDKHGSLDQIYWTKRPVVSLYYLLLECHSIKNSGSNKNSKNKKHLIHDSTKPTKMIETLHNFVRFVYSESEPEVYKRYFTRNIFKNSPVINNSKKEPTIIWPCVRKSYIKGFFKGMKVKNIGCSNALKKLMLDIFIKNDVIYEITEKSYFCSYFYNDDECYFKISMYFNVLLSEHYLILTCLNSQQTCFNTISKIIYDSLNAHEMRQSSSNCIKNKNQIKSS